MKTNDVLRLFQGVKREGDGWKAKCPAHDDKNPSPSIIDGDDGRTLLHCNAGCGVEDICRAVGLKLDDLFSNESKPRRAPKGRIVATYNYTGENGNVLFQSVRYEPKDFKQRRPDLTKPGQWLWNLKDVQRVLFRLPEILTAKAAGHQIFICEGEKDVLAMVKVGFSATCNAGGAGKWDSAYTETLRGASVCIIADKDKAGREHAQMVASKLHGVASSVKVIELPDVERKTVKDSFDFLTAGGTPAQIQNLYAAAPDWTAQGALAAATGCAPAQSRPLRVNPPPAPMDFQQWQNVIAANFPAFARPAEVCASVVAQLLLNDVANPFALALVDVPSSGKTITLNFFDVPDLAYTTDNFTPASFVSQASNVRREDLASVDLLPRIRFRTLIVRDLAPIFGVKEDELLKTMGILTRALDGEGLETDSGVHGKRGYKGDWLFMFLAATTPIPPRVFKIMGTLGSRLFFLALHSKKKSHDELIGQNRGKSRQEKEKVCRDATNSLLRTLWAAHPSGVVWNKDGDPEECLRVIARCAELLAALRGTIQVWTNDQDGSTNHSVPQIEQPDRINCLLCNLARGHALLRGRTQLEFPDLAPVLEVAFDSAPTIRSKVFRGLLKRGGTLKTGQVEKILRCSKPTALKEMETLSVLGVADRTEANAEYGRPEHEIRIAEKFRWFASGDAESLQWPDERAEGGNL